MERPALSLKLADQTIFVASLPLPERGRPKASRPATLSILRERLLADLVRTVRSESAIHLRDLSPLHHGHGDLRVVHDIMGRPHVHGKEQLMPAISFSYGGNRLWAALGGCSTHMGMDVSDPGDFQWNYPFHRVFLKSDWSVLPDNLHRESSDAAAFVWSLKEAAVKALGCGFHYFGPWEVSIRRPPAIGQGDCFDVVFHPPGEELASALDSVRVTTAAWRMDKFWLALASCGRHAAEPFRRALARREAIFA